MRARHRAGQRCRIRRRSDVVLLAPLCLPPVCCAAQMRKRTGADVAFPEVYDKVRPELKVCDRDAKIKMKAQ